MASKAAARLTITEKQWSQIVFDAARRLGWYVYRVHDSRRTVPGWPDIVAIKGPAILVLELKVGRGRLTPAQREWLDAWRQVPNATVMAPVYPDDWDALVAVLAA